MQENLFTCFADDIGKFIDNVTWKNLILADNIKTHKTPYNTVMLGDNRNIDLKLPPRSPDLNFAEWLLSFLVHKLFQKKTVYSDPIELHQELVNIVHDANTTGRSAEMYESMLKAWWENVWYVADNEGRPAV